MAIIENSTFEANSENIVVWFTATVTRDSVDAHGGTFSLLMGSTASGGSGIQLDNFPYYSGIVAGNSYDFSVWYRETTATMPTVTWNITWNDEAGTPQGTTQPVSMPRSASWTQVGATFTAPTGATRVGFHFLWDVAAGPEFRIDDLLIQDAVISAAPKLRIASAARRLP